MTSIAAAIFDFGGVLTEPLFRRTRSVDPAARLVTFFVTEALTVYAEPTSDHDLHRLETGRLTEADYLSGLLARYEAAGNPPLEIEVPAAREALFDQGITACDAMVAAVAAVRAAGVRTALLTNNVREWEDAWRRSIPVDDLFDVVIDSSAVGLRKPDEAIYRLCCRHLGVGPERCLFIDDMLCNVEAAERLGMTVLHCTDPATTAADVLRLVLGPSAAALPNGDVARVAS